MRISIDSGSGSLKTLGSIFHENEDSIDPAGSLLTGVNKILLFGYVENLQESWHNMRILLELIQLDTIKYQLAADLKLINIILEMSSHSGKYACFSCYGKAILVPGPPRTFKNLSEMYENFVFAGHPQNKMSNYFNVIKPCLVKPQDLSLCQ